MSIRINRLGDQRNPVNFSRRKPSQLWHANVVGHIYPVGLLLYFFFNGQQNILIIRYNSGGRSILYPGIPFNDTGPEFHRVPSDYWLERICFRVWCNPSCDVIFQRRVWTAAFIHCVWDCIFFHVPNDCIVRQTAL